MKKYTIILLVAATILNGNIVSAQSKAKKQVAGCPTETKHVAKHHVKRKPMKMSEETITVDDRFKTAVIEINKGKVYYNDSLISTVKNPKWEDHRIVVNYIVPPPPPAIEPAPVTLLDHARENTYTGNKDGNAWLGVYTCNECDGGVWVDEVIPCSPADKAGLFSGAVITKVDDKEITNKEDLINALGNHSAGDKVSISYKEYGHTETTEAKLGDKEHKESCSYRCYSCRW